MSQRRFQFKNFHVTTGWDRPLQYFFLMVQTDDQLDTDDYTYSNLDDDLLPAGAMTLMKVMRKLRELDISPPPTLEHDLTVDMTTDVGGIVRDYGRVPAAVLTLLLILWSTTVFAQPRVYTNADLRRPLPAVRPVVDQQTLTGLTARQYRTPVEHRGPRVVVVPYDGHDILPMNPYTGMTFPDLRTYGDPYPNLLSVEVSRRHRGRK
jgi:hypothetical protein